MVNSIDLLLNLKNKYSLPMHEINVIIESINSITISKQSKNNKSIKRVKVKNNVSTDKVKSKSNMNLSYNDIEKIFLNKTNDEILSSFTLIQLKELYFTIYEFKPLSNKNKLDLIKDIKQHFSSKKRLLSFNAI